MKYKYYILIIIIAAIASCKPEIDEFDINKGTADFTVYLAAGNSLTAGFADGALYTSGQENSFPNILAMQFKTVGGGDFKQPLINTELGVGVGGTGLTPVLNTKYVLGYRQDCLDRTSLGPVLADPNANQQELFLALTTSVSAQGPFNNIGVPGARSVDLLFPGYGQLNNYYGRFAENPQTDAIIGEVDKLPFTFFSLWIGNNDVLGYALAGGEINPMNPTTAITPEQQFSGAYDAIIASLTAGNQKGAIANIPDITSIPFFTTVKYNALQLDADQAGQLNAAYAPYNAAIDQFQLPVPKIEFSAGYNAFIIADTNQPYNLLGGFRQIGANELILLSCPQDSLFCAGWGSQKPIPAQFTLIGHEVENIENAINAFNDKIRDVSVLNNLAHVDLNKAMSTLSTEGLIIDGVELNATFVQGNIFSLDGIHLTPVGNAMVAHYFIAAINQAYGASLPQVNITDYAAVQYP
jgi:hypothetical protein